jgi:hypothetical protein
MNSFQFSPEMIVTITGVIISLVFSYFPALRTAFGKLQQEVKSGIMLGLMALVVAAVAGLNCAGWINAGVTCDQVGLQQLVWWFFLAVTSNQVTYVASPQAADVKRAKMVRDRVG